MQRQSFRDTENLLICSLTHDDQCVIAPHMTRVALSVGQTLCSPNYRIENLYFPETAVIHTIYISDDGCTTEVSLTGNKGVLGVAPLLGISEIPYHAIVAVPGTALRISTQALRRRSQENGPLNKLLLRYVYALLIQTSQLAVCNRLHPVEQRLARWLLFLNDRTGCSELRMTHEAIAGLLGTHRSGVSVAAKGLRALGAIDYDRGCVKISDLEVLELSACECFSLVRREFGKIRPGS